MATVPHEMVRLERMLDYRGVRLQRFHCTCRQFTGNLSITDTLGPEKQFVIQRFPLFRGYYICIAIHLDPQKQSVMERFSQLGEFVMSGSTVALTTSSE